MSKTALITGASHGIGSATALAFAHAGYNIVLNYHNNAAAAEEIAEQCRKAGVETLALKGDMSDEQDIAKLKEQVLTTFGKLDVLVNNAAFTDEPSFNEADKESIVHALTQNFVTAALAIRAFVPDSMQPQSSVLCVASIYGLDQSGNPKAPIYSASKAAMINFIQSMAKLYAPTIRFNAVAPGYTLTPSWDDVSAERKQNVIGSTLLKEWVSAEEIASTLLFLASTPHINAETIVVDSGWSKRNNL
jgi:NAD(P)-dependent dehydrogenase (short-subunit alcohol dehydrogenase family)